MESLREKKHIKGKKTRPRTMPPSIKNNCGGKRRKKSCAYDVLTLPYMQN